MRRMGLRTRLELTAQRMMGWGDPSALDTWMLSTASRLEREMFYFSGYTQEKKEEIALILAWAIYTAWERLESEQVIEELANTISSSEVRWEGLAVRLLRKGITEEELDALYAAFAMKDENFVIRLIEEQEPRFVSQMSQLVKEREPR